jgi:hypothetical protein
MKLLIMQFSLISRHFNSLWSKYSPQHPVLKHSQFVLPLNVRDQVSHTYKTVSKIMVLNILILLLLQVSETKMRRGKLVPMREMD